MGEPKGQRRGIAAHRGGGATPSLDDLARLDAAASSVAAVPGRRVRSERPRVWDLPATCHCVVVGTCLTLPEIRRAATRLGLFQAVERMTDYELHGAFVHALDGRNRASAVVQKLLEANHAGAVRRSLRCTDSDALGRFWDEAVAEGAVAGAFWALLTHPLVDPRLEKRVFGEVHMMSHLCGASHRADARSLSTIGRQRADLARRAAAASEVHREALAERDAEIARLKRLVAGLEPFVIEVSDLRARVARAEAGQDLAALRSTIDLRDREIASLAAMNRRLEGENRVLRTRCGEAEARAERLADALVDPPDRGGPACEATCPLNLGGRCVAYVGGRPQTIGRIRSFVERCNGCLLHHDGGLEQSPQVLEGILGRADIVVVPVDCVSHGAMERARSSCAARDAVFAALPSSSFSAFAAVLAQVTGAGSSRAPGA